MVSNKRLTIELAISIIIMAVCIFAIVVAGGYEDPMEGEYPTLRSTFVPILWASFLGGLGFIYFLTLLARKKRETFVAPAPSIKEQRPEETEREEPETPSNRQILVTVFLTGIALFIYCYLLKKVHFAFLTIGFLFTLLSVYEGIRRWLINLIIASVAGIAIYVFFVILMQIPL